MLFVERSNRTERLFDGLAERLAAPGRDPLARAVVVVQGAGMERWIAQHMARRHGVCANVEFPFPRPFLESVFAALPGRAAAPWDLERMTFAIAKAIDAARGEPDYAPLARHLEAADGDWRLIQLAHAIANVFDQYITYRPDWVRHWELEDGQPPELADVPDARWQSRLFRALRDQLGPGHLASRALAFIALAESSQGEPIAAALRRRFPDAVEIFAVSTLPPLYLSVVAALARLVDVRLSILAPSRAWYSDLWRELRESDGALATPIGALLSGLGRLGADFQQVVVERASPDGGEREPFEVPDAGRADASLLHRLQARLLDLDEAEQAPAARVVVRDDDSIRVHLCHGPRRELEVVASVLRDAFERDASLLPEDVIVMAPDIDAIAADIDAVFGPGAEEQGGLPYRIADRGSYRRSPVADAFRGLLALAPTRMSRSAVFDWLALPDVAARFGLDEEAVLSLADWAERAGIRFGLDEHHRESFALPPLREHTVAAGLDRLVLAHALGDTSDCVRGLVPVGQDRFADPAWIGALCEVDLLLRSAVEGARMERSVADWTHWLANLLARAVARSDANSHEHAAIATLFERLRTAAEATGFERTIPFAAMRERVVAALEASPAPQAFLAGGVTFCQLVPLRAIPFRIVVVTGLVDGEFPRSRAPIGFDLMARAARAGDRSLRDDDRHLFLEALLSARDKLVLTVPAHDLRDGAARPPSIVVSELLDALGGAFELDRAEGNEGVDAPRSQSAALRDWLVVRHPLQATSLRYFERDRDPRLVSRNEWARRAAIARARAMADPKLAPRRFVPPMAGDAEGARRSVVESLPSPLPLEELIARVLRPTRHFAREVVGLRLPRSQEGVGDLDPFEISPLERSAIGRSLFADLAAGVPLEIARRRLRADPRLPPGPAGMRLARQIAAEVGEIARIAASRRQGERRPDFSFALELPSARTEGRVVVVGRLDALWSEARVEADYGRIGQGREIDLWIRHLVLCALAQRGEALPRRSIAVGRPAGSSKSDRVVLLDAVAEPLAILGQLVDRAARAGEVPLPFFERTSRSFAERIARKPDKPADAWRAARSDFGGWDESGHHRAEADQELETGLIWEGIAPIARAESTGLPEGFDELALSLFEPLLKVRSQSPR